MSVIIGLILMALIQVSLWGYYDHIDQKQFALILAVLALINVILLLMQISGLKRHSNQRSQYNDKINRLQLQLDRLNFSLKVNDDRLNEHRYENFNLQQDNQDLLQVLSKKIDWLQTHMVDVATSIQSQIRFMQELLADKHFLRQLANKKSQQEFSQVDFIAIFNQSIASHHALIQHVELDEEQVFITSDAVVLKESCQRLLSLFSQLCRKLDCHLICYTDSELGDCVKISFRLVECKLDCAHLIKKAATHIHQQLSNDQEIGMGYQMIVIEQLLQFLQATYTIRSGQQEKCYDFSINLPLKTDIKLMKLAG